MEDYDNFNRSNVYYDPDAIRCYTGIATYHFVMDHSWTWDCMIETKVERVNYDPETLNWVAGKLTVILD